MVLLALGCMIRLEMDGGLSYNDTFPPFSDSCTNAAGLNPTAVASSKNGSSLSFGLFTHERVRLKSQEKLHFLPCIPTLTIFHLPSK
jgi:hypothetical protein